MQAIASNNTQTGGAFGCRRFGGSAPMRPGRRAISCGVPESVSFAGINAVDGSCSMSAQFAVFHHKSALFMCPKMRPRRDVHIEIVSRDHISHTITVLLPLDSRRVDQNNWWIELKAGFRTHRPHLFRHLRICCLRAFSGALNQVQIVLDWVEHRFVPSISSVRCAHEIFFLALACLPWLFRRWNFPYIYGSLTSFAFMFWCWLQSLLSVYQAVLRPYKFVVMTTVANLFLVSRYACRTFAIVGLLTRDQYLVSGGASCAVEDHV